MGCECTVPIPVVSTYRLDTRTQNTCVSGQTFSVVVDRVYVLPVFEREPFVLSKVWRIRVCVVNKYLSFLFDAAYAGTGVPIVMEYQAHRPVSASAAIQVHSV